MTLSNTDIIQVPQMQSNKSYSSCQSTFRVTILLRCSPRPFLLITEHEPPQFRFQLANKEDSNHVNGPSEPEIEEVNLVRTGGPLGLSIVGGIDHSSYPFGADKPGIFISKVSSDHVSPTFTKLTIYTKFKFQKTLFVFFHFFL